MATGSLVMGEARAALDLGDVGRRSRAGSPPA